MHRYGRSRRFGNGTRTGYSLSARWPGSRIAPLLACLLLLSGCASLPDMVPDWLVELTGGEGKIAQPVPSSVIDAPSEPEQTAPLASDVRSVQLDLAELGYQPGPADGYISPMTQQAVEAYQRDAGLEVDGRITPELVASLAEAPRPARTKPAGVAVPAEQSPDETPTATETQELAEVEEPTEAQEPNEVQEPADPPTPVIVVKNADALPVYGAGDKYIWSTGQTETVARIIGSKLEWKVNNGVRFKADRNFLIPPSTWTGPLGSGEANAQVDPRASWPLVADTPLSFDVQENGKTMQWVCESLGGRIVIVPAGQFEAVDLACERAPVPDGEWVRRIWSYAPAVRHYVSRTDVMADGRQVSRYLVGVRPGNKHWPPAVRAGLDRAIQATLENVPSGGHYVWTSTVVEEEFDIRPGPIRKNGSSIRCRHFEIVARSAKGSRLYPAFSCADGGGDTWRIPSPPEKKPDGLSGLTNAG